uniref:Tubulin-specific chaperone cofactor E-like protein n=1 Tax=Sus scrofa TaxID=9823 RepID=A0A4X1UVL7_PIG
MDQPSGRSFMQVLCEKYSPENFPYRRGPGMGVHVPATPQGSPMKDRLNLPSVLVLNSCGITCAGDEKEIAAFCAHVSELDLSDNKLEDWHEKEHVLGPSLGFENLSSTTAKLPGRQSTRYCRSYQSKPREHDGEGAMWPSVLVHRVTADLPSQKY